jgi:bifunctional non-homologous end joining protein LigD
MSPQLKKKRNSTKVSKTAKPVTDLTVRLTHPDRVVYPEQGITKRDLAAYYVAVSEWMFPHVVDRPLAIVRCPAGMSGECFFQKHPPPGMSAVDRIQIREKSGTSPYVVIRDLKGLITLIQFGALEIHAWGSRADDIEHPDRVVFDLDPDPSVPWKRVISAAELLRKRLKQRQLKSFIKTTGGKGLHIVVPIARRYSWPEIKQFAKDIAERLVFEAPEQYIATMSKAARQGKIFIDYLRNERGATAVVAYSSRAKTGAPVSTPIAWEELRGLKSPQQFTVENLAKRLQKLRSDPWEDLPDLRQSIAATGKKVIVRR